MGLCTSKGLEFNAELGGWLLSAFWVILVFMCIDCVIFGGDSDSRSY